jgi:DNA replication protein DnaC
MKTVPMLVLDDVAREKQSDWTRQILFDVINYRYEHMTPTIITANLSLDALGNYLGRDIFSRLYETSVAVETRGGNYRER